MVNSNINSEVSVYIFKFLWIIGLFFYVNVLWVIIGIFFVLVFILVIVFYVFNFLVV